jgi:dienelactone hydrolase
MFIFAEIYSYMPSKVADILKCFLLAFSLTLLLSSCSYNRAFFKHQQAMLDLPDTVNKEIISIKNSQGKKVSGVFFKPSVEPKATVFMLKGNNGDITEWYDLISIMLKHGYQVFTFDYEGMGESEGRATHKNVLTDCQLFLKQLRKLPDVKEKRLILWGFSFGGNLAVKLTNNNPGIFDLVILEGAFTSQRKAAIQRIPWVLKPFAFCLATSPYASKKYIDKLDGTPVIVVHSVEDKEIPYRMGEEIFKKAQEPKQFFEVLGDHCSALKYYQDEYFANIDKMLAGK